MKEFSKVRLSDVVEACERTGVDIYTLLFYCYLVERGVFSDQLGKNERLKRQFVNLTAQDLPAPNQSFPTFSSVR